jgi:3',5'-cyclic-AMP phosphodiesterase
VVPLGTGKTVGTFVSPAQARHRILRNGIVIEPSGRVALFRTPPEAASRMASVVRQDI